MIFPAFSSEIEDIYTEITKQGCHTICISSPNSGEGVSSIAHSLTQRILLSGQSALLVDLNIHRPAIRNIIDASNEKADRFSETMTVPSLVSPKDENIVFEGSQPRSDRASTVKLKKPGEINAHINAWLESHAYVVVDTPSVLDVNETGLSTESIAQVCDATILVTLSNRTTESNLVRAVNKLESVNANLIGLILNDKHNPYLRDELIRQLDRIKRFVPSLAKRVIDKLKSLIHEHSFFSIET